MKRTQTQVHKKRSSRTATERSLGVLVLHGFTSSLNTVSGLAPCLEREGIAYEMPVLRGHGREPEFLLGVTYRDWVEDAQAALLRLAERCQKIVVVGLSMGGLVALEMGLRFPEQVIGVVTVAPALRFTNPLAVLSPYLSPIVRYFPSPMAFINKSLAEESDNYPRFPVSAFASLYEFSKVVEAKLGYFDRPLLILQHRINQVTNPKGAVLLYEKVASQEKQLKWFEKSGHEMMRDCEREAVFADIMTFIKKVEKQHV